MAIDQQLADSGVFDLVIGHHAHVPQPVAHLSGGPRGEGMWVAYGLGNYVSNQDGECCSPNTASGLLLTAHVEATGAFPAEGRPAGPARVTGVEWTPITVDRWAATRCTRSSTSRGDRHAERRAGGGPDRGGRRGGGHWRHRSAPPRSRPTGVVPYVVPRVSG